MTEGIVGASVHFEPLPSGATVKLYARVDSTTSWGSAIATVSTANSLRLDAVAAQFSVKDGKEWHFRIESLGGAVVTGFEAITKPKQDKPYGA